MKFSLIVATIGRTNEFKRFLESLLCQTNQNYELIVVDQNDDDRIIALIDLYRLPLSGKLIYLRSERGLSKARNVALQSTTGDIIAFPDDDCWYSEDLLEKVETLFKQYPNFDCIVGKSFDPITKDDGGVRWRTTSHTVNKYNLWWSAISYTIFAKSNCIHTVGYFDESLGVGSGTQWGACEETDFLARALTFSLQIRYEPTLIVYHPAPQLAFDQKAINRAYMYGMGIGRVMHKNQYPFLYFMYFLARPLIAMCLYFITGHKQKSLFYQSSLHGRIRGWRSSVL